MHIAFIFPSQAHSSSVHTLTHTIKQYATALIRSVRDRDSAVRITAVSTIIGDEKPSVQAETLGGECLLVRRCFRLTTGGLLSLLWKIRPKEFDVIHIQHETFLYGGPLSLLVFPFVVRWMRFSAPVVVTLHHVVHPKNITKKFAAIYLTRMPPLLIRFGYAFFYRLIGAAASQIIVHERCDQATLTDAYGIAPQKISTIPHGAEDRMPDTASPQEPLREQFCIPDDARRIYGFLGYLDFSKGIDILVEEFLAHLTLHPKDVLIIGGTPNPHYVKTHKLLQELQYLKDRTKQSGNGRIIWYGEIPGERIGGFYRLIDAVIIPYYSFNGGSASMARAISFNLPALLSEAFAESDTGPAILFSLSKGGLQEKLHLCDSLERLPHPADPQFRAWRESRLWKTVGERTLEVYRSLVRTRSPSPILLLGAYGQKNLGDELLLSACLDRLPRQECTVASADPAETERTHAVRAVPSRLSRAFLQSFLSATTIVVGGGDQFKLLKKSMRRAPHSLLLRELLVIATAKLLRKHVFFVGVGIGTVNTRLGRLLTSVILRLADTVTFRDRTSARTARSLAPRALLHESADLAFLQEPISRPTANEPRRLGVAPVFTLDHEDAFTGVIRELGTAVDSYLQRQDGRSAVFLPFQTGGHHHHDLMTSGEILDHVKMRQRCSVDDRLTIHSAEQTFRSLDILWGMRLHSLILACLYQVPFIALVYDVKVRQFLEEIDYLEWGIPLDASFTAEKLLALHRRLEDVLPSVRSHLQAQAQRLHKRAAVNARLLQSIADSVTGTTSLDPCFLPFASQP